MNIEQSTARKIQITGVDNLDPVSVYLEDFAPGKGKITISCWDKSWHSYWGGMGNRTISEFFLSCDNGYLTKNLSSIRSVVNDYETLMRDVINHYGEDDIDFFLADELESLEDNSDWEVWVRDNSKIMIEVYGEDWHYAIPVKENYQYTYLCKIIDTVKEALGSL